MERIKELVEILNVAREEYYNNSKSTMSDIQYDKLYDELLDLEEKTGIVYGNSPTQEVGFEVLSSLKKVRHNTRMLSLDKTKSTEDLKSFLGEEEGLLSWKIDGITVILTYENGELIQSATRGNGEVGEDITHNTKMFSNIPLKINYKGTLVIRGEAVITFSDFNRINEELGEDEKYKNPRNLCSGTVRQLDNKICYGRKVKFIAFKLVSDVDVDFKNKKENEFKFLNKEGFEVVEHFIIKSNSVDNTINMCSEKVKKLDYATDGLVLTYNNILYSISLGETSKFPKDSIAFKWKDEIKSTKLIEIDWNCSRTGAINPIAIFEAVELEGTTVNRASLHNLSIVKSLELGIGDEVMVYKANMIIPQISENLTKSNSLEIPTKCPICNEKTTIVVQKEGEVLFCKNPNCLGKSITGISHYVSRDAMNIEGFSEATIEKFILNGFIKKKSDIYKLSQYEDDIKALEGFGEKSYTKLIKSIENSKECNVYNFIYALGINQVGLRNAKLLSKYYKGNIESIINSKAEDMINIDGFGEVICNSIEEYFSIESNKEEVLEILEYLTFIKEEVEDLKLIFENKVFVITGDINNYANRKELQKEIESLGGKVTGSVSKKTNYLINNDVNSSSSKNKKAMDLKIPIITEDDYIKLKEDN